MRSVRSFWRVLALSRTIGSFCLGAIVGGLAACSTSDQLNEEVTMPGELSMIRGGFETALVLNPQKGIIDAGDQAFPIQTCSSEGYYCFEGTIDFSFPKSAPEPNARWTEGDRVYELHSTAYRHHPCDKDLQWSQVYLVVAKRTPDDGSEFRYYVDPKWGVMEMEWESCRPDKDGACSWKPRALYRGCSLRNWLIP